MIFWNVRSRAAWRGHCRTLSYGDTNNIQNMTLDLLCALPCWVRRTLIRTQIISCTEIRHLIQVKRVGSSTSGWKRSRDTSKVRGPFATSDTLVLYMKLPPATIAGVKTPHSFPFSCEENILNRAYNQSTIRQWSYTALWMITGTYFLVRVTVINKHGVILSVEAFNN